MIRLQTCNMFRLKTDSIMFSATPIPRTPFWYQSFLDSLFFPSSFEMMANHLLHPQGSSLSRVM